MLRGLTEVEHVQVDGGPNLVCHWPRQGGIWRRGDEILVGYIESPCEYKDPQEVGHGLEGIWKRGYVRLRRSLDGGMTWADAGKLFANSLPLEEQRRILHLDDYSLDDINGPGGPEREMIDMTSPDAIVMMGRAFCDPESKRAHGTAYRGHTAYSFRSPDRGRLWEEVPSIIRPNHTRGVIEGGNNCLKMGGARLICWVVGCGEPEAVSERGRELCSPQLYASEDHGVTWDFYSEIYYDTTGRAGASYPYITVLPSGRWLCFLGAKFLPTPRDIRWTSLCVSDDEGLNRSEPRRIHSWSVSPFPILLDDGRLVMIYMRRVPDPTGLYGIVSEDEGL